MAMRYVPLFLALIVALSACHPGPVVDTTPRPSVGGTIAGIVTTADSTVAVPGRKVTAIEVSSGSRYEATTGVNGGYTIKVPQGTYRIEIELRGGEALAKRPDQTHINNGDLDPGRDFVITIRSGSP
jgi:Carboxypeptidase regulatory-like domain